MVCCSKLFGGGLIPCVQVCSLDHVGVGKLVAIVSKHDGAVYERKID